MFDQVWRFENDCLYHVQDLDLPVPCPGGRVRYTTGMQNMCDVDRVLYALGFKRLAGSSSPTYEHPTTHLLDKRLAFAFRFPATGFHWTVLRDAVDRWAAQ